jgi:hypothetical protein
MERRQSAGQVKCNCNPYFVRSADEPGKYVPDDAGTSIWKEIYYD